MSAVRDHALPTVTAVVAAYEYGRFVERALESAMGQDHPAELLDVVVVDDGSTDETPDVVAAVQRRHPGRITYVRQENAGYVAASNRGLALARGELLAVLDADDTWPAEKTRRQVELLAARPDVGLVYSDMTVIDPDDTPVHESVWAFYDATPLRGTGQLGALLGPRGNVATASSILVRASLRAVFDPVPAAVPYVDWWIAARVAGVAAIDHVEGLRCGYRLHGENLTLGAQGPGYVRELLKLAEFRRRMLAEGAGDALAPHELLDAWEAMEWACAEAVRQAGSGFVATVPATTRERAAAREGAHEAAALAAAGDGAAALRAWVRAGALDPFAPQPRAAIRGADAALRRPAPAPEPDALAGARSVVVLAFADELLADPRLLEAYGRAFGADDDVTLAIHALGMDPADAAERLGGAVTAAGLDDEHAPDLLAVPGTPDPAVEAALVGRADALLTARPLHLGPPAFPAERLGALRGLVDAALGAAA